MTTKQQNALLCSIKTDLMMYKESKQQWYLIRAKNSLNKLLEIRHRVSTVMSEETVILKLVA